MNGVESKHRECLTQVQGGSRGPETNLPGSAGTTRSVSTRVILSGMAEGDESGLRLNELQRFRKTSSRLALEAHGSCEVPAGCGGVVLRWRRPGAAVGLSFSTYVEPETDDICLDGEKLDEQRTEVAPGEHVLSFTVEAPADRGFLLMMVHLRPDIPTARRPKASSSADGSWRAALEDPEVAGWRLPGFDDSGFLPLIERPVPEPKGNLKWSWEWLQETAKGLGLPESASTKGGWLSRLRRGGTRRAWVRWRFRVDHEGFG